MAEKRYREERAAQYREMADEAEDFARQSAFPANREQYQKLARDWRKLADDLERGSSAN